MAEDGNRENLPIGEVNPVLDTSVVDKTLLEKYKKENDVILVKQLKKNMIIGIGHPLLDISAKVDQGFLAKYNLKENDACLLSELQKNLLKELLERYEVNYTVGGSIQNTLRIVQWLTNMPGLTTFFGSVGNDEFADILYKQAILDGVNVKYKYNEKQPTGTCIVLITEKNRSLCTNPGSSTNFNFEFLKNEDNQILLNSAEYYYLGGFFLNVCLTTVKEIAKLAVKNNRQFLFNLSAPFICHKFKDELLEIFPYIDVLFGNKSEIEALATNLLLNTQNIEETIIILSDWQKTNSARSRIVVLTQGEDPVFVAKDKQIIKISVPELPTEKIVDTSGAGDAFVGGFIFQYIQNNTIDICVQCGIWAASQIIQKIGCTCDGRANYQI